MGVFLTDILSLSAAPLRMGLSVRLCEGETSDWLLSFRAYPCSVFDFFFPFVLPSACSFWAFLCSVRRRIALD